MKKTLINIGILTTLLIIMIISIVFLILNKIGIFDYSKKSEFENKIEYVLNDSKYYGYNNLTLVDKYIDEYNIFGLKLNSKFNGWNTDNVTENIYNGEDLLKDSNINNKIFIIDSTWTTNGLMAEGIDSIDNSLILFDDLSINERPNINFKEFNIEKPNPIKITNSFIDFKYDENNIFANNSIIMNDIYL